MKEQIAKMVLDWLDEVLKDAELQIEYLHDKFKATSSGETILTRIRHIQNKEALK